MQRCNKCKIQIRGSKARCPLCEGPLNGEAERPAFPVLSKERAYRLPVIRLSLVLYIAFLAVMGVLAFILDGIPGWMILAVLAATVGLIDVALTLYYRNNLLRLVTLEIYLVMLIVLMVDIFTGYPMWSMIWVIPILFMAIPITTIAIGKGTHMAISEYILYLLFDVVMATGIQLLFLLAKWNTFPLPAVISIALHLVLFLALVIFNHRAFRGEARKFFNV